MRLSGLANIIGNSLAGGHHGAAAGFSNLYSANFDGVDDHITTDATYSILDGQAQMSISIWVKPVTGGSTLRMVYGIGRLGSTELNSQLVLWLYEGGRIEYNVSSGGAWARGDITAITYGSWNNILLTFDLSQPSSVNKTHIYVNGADVSTGNNINYSSFQNSVTALYIGETSTGKYNPFNGSLDEMAVWQGLELSAADAVTIYNSGTPTDLSTFSTPPTNWWRMGDNNGGSGTVLTDESGSANATLLNGTVYTTDVP